MSLTPPLPLLLLSLLLLLLLPPPPNLFSMSRPWSDEANSLALLIMLSMVGKI